MLTKNKTTELLKYKSRLDAVMNPIIKELGLSLTKDNVSHDYHKLKEQKCN